MKQTACVWNAESVEESCWDKVLDCLETCTPQLELEAPGTVYLEAAGMGALYGDWAAWSDTVLTLVRQTGVPRVRLGIAAGYLAARLAAEFGAAETCWHRVVETDRAYLARFPLDILPLADEPRRRMGLLGINTMGQLARLSARAVAEQFGPEVLPCYRLACGAEGAPRSIRQARQVAAACTFDPGTVDQGELYTALLGIAQPLWDALRREGRGVRRIVLRAAGWHWQDEQTSEVLANLAGEPDLQVSLRTLLARLDLGGLVEESEVTLQGVLPFLVRQPMLWTTKEAQSELQALAKRLTRRCPDGVLHGERRKPWAPLSGEHYGLVPWSVS
jgi:hypothetical protein